jgi:hypothetical protein
MKLNHCQAEIIHKYLVDADAIVEPPTTEPWPGFYNTGNVESNNSVVVMDTTNTTNGKTAPDREVQEHFGFQVVVRSADKPTGYAKCADLTELLDQVSFASVTLGETEYILDNLKRTSSVLYAGFEETSNRVLHTVNYLASIGVRT